MPSVHVVAQGEYLTMIAAQYGFLDPTVIWDDTNNAQLKQLRADFNVLLPGDSVFIPDKEQKQEQGVTGKRHIFKISPDKLKLRFVVEDMYEKPVANAQCTLLVESQSFDLSSDAKGKLEQEIAVGSQKGMLIIKSDETPFQSDTIRFRIGDLDPVDSTSGQRDRLSNLGYRAGSTDDPHDPAFLSALEEFQCENGLKVDGDPGPQTQSKLKQVHGC